MKICRVNGSVLRRASLMVCGLTALLPSCAGAVPAQADASRHKPELNQSQDRLIKRGSFKDVSIDGAAAIPNKEIGIFAALAANDLSDREKLKALAADPRISGLSVMLGWRQLEPEQGKLDWQAVDKLLDLVREQGKTLILRVSTCGSKGDDARCDTPAWVFEEGAKSITYKDADGKERLMPIYWDSVYLAKWSNFVRALGERYDNNSSIQSVGITGGGVGAGTALIPVPSKDKVQFDAIVQTLKNDFGSSQHQLVQEWKYVADLFPAAFKVARLNFDIDPPMPDRSGEATLDEISDYLIYRYGERVYLTRENIESAKHGFDQYRILTKFRPDTLSGYQIAQSFPASELDKLVKNCLDDGVSFVEVPTVLLESKDPVVLNALEKLRSRLGYQLVSQKVSLPDGIKSGAALKAGFTFINLGDTVPMRPSRQLDKDIVASYKIQLELRDANGKPVVISFATPSVPTNKWIPGQPISWEQDLKMPKLRPGQYSVWLSLVDVDAKRKLQILDASQGAQSNKPGAEISVGKVQIID